MPTSALDIGSAWANVGKQLFQGQGAFEQGKTKMAQALAQEAMMGARAKESEAQAGLHTAKSDQLRQRMQYQTPEFSNKIAAGLAGLSEAQLPEIEAYLSGSAPAPAYFTPDVQQRFNQGRGAHLANLGATGDTNAEQLIKGVEILAKRGDLDRTMANPAQAGNVGQAYAAVEGKPLFHQGANGTMQNFTGVENINEIGRSAAKENIAKAAQAYAAANNQNATAKLHESQIPEVQSRIDLNKSKIGVDHVVINPDGTQTIIKGSGKPGKDPTEFQSKSATFGARAQEAHDLLNSLDGKYSLHGSAFAGGNGVVSTVLNPLLKESTQNAIQAQRNFINAVLRQESGAAISPSEFDNAAKQYFPQPGDSPSVIETKRKNRETAIQGFQNSAGRAAFTPEHKKTFKEFGYPSAKEALSDAKKAIQGGAPRAAVIQRLREMGINEGAI